MREDPICNRASLEGLTGRYSFRGELEFEGSISGLTALATLLRRTNEIKIVTLQVPSCPVDVEPYDGFISTIQLQRAEGKVKIHREGDAIVIVGASDRINLLADNISLLIEDGERGAEHCHIEYYEGHPWLDGKTQPLVITLLKEME